MVFFTVPVRTALFMRRWHRIGQELGQDLAVQVREVGRERLADQVTDEVERSILPSRVSSRRIEGVSASRHIPGCSAPCSHTGES